VADGIMEKPTWESPIKSFFNDIDINHMRARTSQPGRDFLDLADYENVRANARRIADQVKDDFMPMDPSPRWTQSMKDAFERWIDLGTPQTPADLDR